MGKTAIVIDDSTYMRMMIKRTLEEQGYEIVGECSTGMEAIDMSIEKEPDLITLDNILPDMMGIDILKTLKEDGLSSEIVMISAVGQQSMLDKAKALGARHYVVKPFNEDQLKEVIQKVNEPAIQ